MPQSLTCRVAAVLFLLFFSVGCGGQSPAPEQTDDHLHPTLLLISLDGFRSDYLERHDAPALDQLVAGGVTARKLIPVFPTKTFPNHYSAVTGLYPENHGIISNNMYDPETDASFSMSDPEAMKEARWWGGEPIWVTAEQQGQIAATYFWPGSEAPIRGTRPSYWATYEGAVSGEDRVDQVLAWLDLPGEERPTFISLYLSEVDGAGHRDGPNSRAVAHAVEDVNGYIDRLLRGLERRSLLDEVNLLVMSDHGMAESSHDRVIVIDDYVDVERARIVELSPVLMMYPPESSARETYDALRTNPHLEVYWRDELPERYHLNHPRTPPLIAIAEPGWVIGRRSALTRNPNSFDGGMHGYDHRAPSMAGIFIAHGPAFRRGYVVEPMEIINLYELMCEVLGLEPAPNDGNLDAIASILRDRPAS